MPDLAAANGRDHEAHHGGENTRDLAAYEKTGKWVTGSTVLHGGDLPDAGDRTGDIRLKELMTRPQKEEVREVIIATNSSPGGRDDRDVFEQAD